MIIYQTFYQAIYTMKIQIVNILVGLIQKLYLAQLQDRVFKIKFYSGIT